MNISKPATFALILIMSISFALATANVNYRVYDATVSGNGEFTPGTAPVNNANIQGFVCADADCTTVSGRLWSGAKSTGSDNHITISYPTELQSSHGYLLWWYKDDRILWWSTANWHGSGTAPDTYSQYLAKKEDCKAPINDFTVLNDVQPNVPLVIDVSASLDSTTYSAFNCLTDKYIPSDLQYLLYSDVRVTLTIYDGDDNIVFQEHEDISLRCSNAERVEFTWTPTVSGDYRAVARTTVTDSQCSSTIPQQTYKEFTVLEEEPNYECYTIVNNLATSNPQPTVGEQMDIEFTRISNHAEDDFSLTPVTTDIVLKVIRDSDGHIMHQVAETLPENPNAKDPVIKKYPLDTTGYQPGAYTIKVDGTTTDAMCDGLPVTDDTIVLGFYLEEAPNNAPSLDGLPDKTIDENAPAQPKIIDLWAYADDSESTDEELMFTIVHESNSGLIDCMIEDDRYISCTAPKENSWGYSSINVQVTDGELTDSDSFTITVNKMQAYPEIGNIPNVHMMQDTVLTWPHALDVYVTDPHYADSELTWTVFGEDDVDVSISSSRYATYTPAPGFSGQDLVTFKVTNPDGLSATDDVMVFVTPVAYPPVISDIPDITMDEDTCEILDLDDYVSDPDNSDSELDWSVSGNSNVDIYINPYTHVAEFCGKKDWHGQENVVFTVTDPDSLTDSDDILVTVLSVNDVPVITDIPDVTFPEGSCESLDLDDYVSDPDHEDWELSWSYTGNSVVDITMHPGHLVEFCSDTAVVENVLFTVTDPQGASDSDNVKVTVTEVNDAPVITDIPDVTFPEGSCESLDLDDYVSDPDHEDWELSWSYTGNSVVDITMHPGHLVEFCSDTAVVENVLFTVTDPQGASDSDNVKVTVTEVNDAPVITDIPDVTMYEDECKTLDLDDYVSDPDNSDSELDWSVSGNVNVFVDINPITHVAEFCGAENWNGMENMVFTVEDPDGLTDSDTVLVTVLPVNDDPIILDIPDVTFPEKTCATLDLDNYVTDPDHADSELDWSVAGNSVVDIDIDPVTHIATFCSDVPVVEHVVFTVTDPLGGSDFDNVKVTVTDVNEGPVISDIPDIQMNEDECRSFDLDDYVTDPDNLDSELDWSVSGAVNLIVTIDPSTHIAEVCGKKDWFGEEDLVFNVQDPYGASDSDDVHVTVLPINDAPVLDLPDITFPAGSCESIDLDDYAADVDNLDSELNFNYFGNTYIEITMHPGHVVEFCSDLAVQEQVVFEVTDPEGLSDSDTMTITVTSGENGEPTLLIPDQYLEKDSGFHDDLVDLRDYVFDADTPVEHLIFTFVSETDPGIVDCSLDSNRYIDCDVQPGMIGSSDVTIGVSDGTSTASDTFTVFVQEVSGDISVTVLYPNGGEVIRGNTEIRWQATSTNICPDPISIKIEYSPDSGKTWHLIADDEENDGAYTWDTSTLPDLATYLIKVTATDCEDSAFDISDAVFTINNDIPDKEEDDDLDYGLKIRGIIVNPSMRDAMPGEEVEVLMYLENLGDNLDDLTVTTTLPELGSRSNKVRLDLDHDEQATARMILWVPYWTQPGEYIMRFVVSNTDVRRVEHRDLGVA